MRRRRVRQKAIKTKIKVNTGQVKLKLIIMFDPKQTEYHCSFCSETLMLTLVEIYHKGQSLVYS